MINYLLKQVSMFLQGGQGYKILGWCNAIYVGDEVMVGELQHRFRRADGFGTYYIPSARLDREVQKWEPDAGKLAMRVSHNIIQDADGTRVIPHHYFHITTEALFAK